MAIYFKLKKAQKIDLIQNVSNNLTVYGVFVLKTFDTYDQQVIVVSVNT